MTLLPGLEPWCGGWELDDVLLLAVLSKLLPSALPMPLLVLRIDCMRSRLVVDEIDMSRSRKQNRSLFSFSYAELS